MTTHAEWYLEEDLLVSTLMRAQYFGRHAVSFFLGIRAGERHADQTKI